jgi:hypothetical protein
MSEPVNATIYDQLEGRLWDRVDSLVTNEVMIYAWERAMIPHMERIFNRVFNSVEAPPVAEAVDADV